MPPQVNPRVNPKAVRPAVAQQAVPKMKSQVPTGVKVIAVLFYISVALGVLGGLLSIGIGIFAISSGAQDTDALFGAAFTAIGAAAIIYGIVLIAVAVLNFFIARGLFRARNWARILTIIFAIIVIIFGFIQMFTGGGIFRSLISIIIYGVIGGYLLFSKKVKVAFVKPKVLKQV